MDQVFKKRFSATQSDAIAAVQASLPTLKQMCQSPDDVNLALTEAVTNLVKHAYIGSIGEGELEVRFQEDDTVLCTVSDNGPGIHARQNDPIWYDVQSAPEQGFGLLLMTSLAKSLNIEKVGTQNVVKMTFEGRCPLAQ